MGRHPGEDKCRERLPLPWCTPMHPAGDEEPDADGKDEESTCATAKVEVCGSFPADEGEHSADEDLPRDVLRHRDWRLH